MLLTPTASINMQNRTACLISLAHCAQGFLLPVGGILATNIGLDAELANFPTSLKNAIYTLYYVSCMSLRVHWLDNVLTKQCN